MRKHQTYLSFVVLSAVLVLSYQNCAQQKFSFEKYQGTLCQEISAPDLVPKLKYQFLPNASQQPGFKQFMSTAMVGDLDGNGIPSIVATSFSKEAADWYADALGGSSYSKNGVLRVLNGQTGELKFSVSGESLSPLGQASPLLVDIDKDGTGEIIYPHYNGKKVIALNANGTLRWSWDIPAANSQHFRGCTESFNAADIDGDGKTDILAGGFILNEDSNKQPVLKLNLYSKGESGSTTCNTFARSLNPDKPNEMQILGSTKAFDKNGNVLFNLEPGSKSAADINPNFPGLEIVTTGNGRLVIQNGVTGAIIADKNLTEHADLRCPAGNVGGGPSTLGDFDGDGIADIAIATGKSLTIFDNMGNKGAGSITQDCSSLSTGISSFDFNGDGKQEILYGDEQFFRIFHMTSSLDLQVLHAIQNPSWTLKEHPVVADVDGNESAEIVVVSTEYENNPSQGLRVFGANVDEAWMKTLPVWNQFSYYVSNITKKLQVTSSTPTNDAQSKTFRRNTQNSFFEPACVKAKNMLKL